MASQGSPAPLASELRVALGRLRYARAKHQSERAAWEVAGPSAGALFEAALTDLARERDDLHALVDRHYEACRAELLASRDDADEDAGAAAALDAIDRQCRLVDQTAGAIQETLSGDVAAAAPRLLARADDVLGASRRLSERAASAAPTPSLRDVGRRRGVGDRLRAYLGAEASPARRDAPPPPPSPPTSPFGGDVERLVASLRDEVLSIRDEFRARDASSPPPARPATADAPPRTPLAPQSRPSPTGDALAAADRALAGGREPLSPLTDDRYADLLASSLRDVEASAARSSRRRGLLSSPEEAAAALDRLDHHRGY
jgi:hypothetical protein